MRRLSRQTSFLAVLLGLGPLLSGTVEAQSSFQLQVWTHFGAGLSGTINIEPGDYILSSGFSGYSYAAGTTNTVFALPPAGATFNGWFDCSGGILTDHPAYSLTLDSDRCVQAYFVSSSGPYTLTVYKGAPGSGNGTISGTAGFYCAPDAGSASLGNYGSGAVVLLTNTPSPGWSFAYWETNGVIVPYSGPLQIVMDRDQLVQAIFTHNNLPPNVDIIGPSNNASFYVCSKTVLTAVASDPDGYITNLELFVNGVLVAQDSTSPLNYTVTNEALLTTNVCIATAFDNDGANVTSAPLTFTVQSPGTNQLRALGFVATNAFEFCLCGLSNRVYAVQTSTNVAQFWQSWETVTNNPTGITAIVDRGASNQPAKFYRAGLATSLARVSNSLSISNPAAGGQITISATITNCPCGSTSQPTASFHVGFYGLASTVADLVTLQPFYEQKLNGCSANATISFSTDISIDPQTAPGTYYIGYRIDDENEVPQCDAANSSTIWYWPLMVQ